MFVLYNRESDGLKSEGKKKRETAYAARRVKQTSDRLKLEVTVNHMPSHLHPTARTLTIIVMHDTSAQLLGVCGHSSVSLGGLVLSVCIGATVTKQDRAKLKALTKLACCQGSGVLSCKLEWNIRWFVYSSSDTWQRCMKRSVQSCKK